jgi:hypothetical protein
MVYLDGKARTLQVAIPRGATIDQLRVFSDATRYAQQRNVHLQFRTIE